MIPTLSYRADEPMSKQAAAAAMPGWTENDDGELVPEGVDLIDVDDMVDRRGRFYKSAANAFTKSFPKVYGGLRMEVGEVDYDGPEDWSPAEQKKALLTDGFLARKLRGNVSLYDDKTNELIEQKRVSLMRVPHLTERGTFIHGGNEYTTVMQSRLVPGVYTRRRGNGELETQFNVRPGTGRQFRVGFEPESAQYRMRVSTSNLHLYSLLKDLGVPDEQLAASWGDEILDINRKKYDKRVFEKAYQKFVPPHMRKEQVSPEAKREAIRSALEGMQMSELVARRHLPVLFDRKKQAAYREPEPVWFDPDIAPAAAKASTRWTVGEDFRVKFAAFDEDELRVLALFLRDNAGAALPMDLTGLDAGMLEEAIINAVTQGNTGVNAAILQAGVEGLANVKQADFYEDLTKAAFDPNYEPDDIVDVYNNVYGQVGPRLASMKQWPEAWLDEQDPMGWLQWYEQYHAGRRSDQDERQIRRWEGFKKRHGALYVRKPTPRRGFALRNWAIDGPAMLPEAQQEQARRDMEDYRQGTYKAKASDGAKSAAVMAPAMPTPFAGTKPAPRNDEDDPGDSFVPVGLDGILASTEKLLAVNRGLEEPDERDSLPNDRIYMPHDLLAERIRIDTGKLGHKAMRYASRHRSLRGLMPFAFDDYATGLLVGNPLSQPLEEINPMQIAEQARRFTKMGPGGIGDPKAITVEMQSVHPSHFGFISPLEGPECFSADTEVYTLRGWVRWDQVLDDDTFACRVDGQLEWHPAERIVRERYQGQMLVAESKTVRMCVTPSHRVLHTYSSAGREHVKTAEAVFHAAVRLPSRHAPEKGDDQMVNFTLPSIEKVSNRDHSKAFDAFAIGDWCEFLGWWLAEGSLFVGTRKNGYATQRVGIAQDPVKNPENCARIRELFQRMGLAGAEGNGHEFVVCAKQFVTYFTQWPDGCLDKFIPEELFKAPLTARQRMFDALIAGDGSHSSKVLKYCTVSERLAKSVERLAVSLGFSAYTKVVGYTKRKAAEGRAYYNVRIIRRAATSVYPSHWRRENYDGVVYCATVPGGFLHVRGKSSNSGFWSGNSEKIGVDARITVGTKVGSDRRLYTRVYDRRNGGKVRWVSPEMLQGRVVKIPD